MAPPVDKDHYPEPVISRSVNGAGTWRVIVLALVFIAGAVGLSQFGITVRAELVLVALGLLAVFGVFCLFAFAAGLFRFAGGGSRDAPFHALLSIACLTGRW